MRLGARDGGSFVPSGSERGAVNRYMRDAWSCHPGPAYALVAGIELLFRCDIPEIVEVRPVFRGKPAPWGMAKR